MALAIATNTGALMAAASATSVNKDMETSMERLSTGKRINSAKDDAAGVAIASRLSSEIRGTNQAIRNAQDGQALINTAEGAHKEIENILQRMRELSTQAANDTNDSVDRGNLQAEMTALTEEINRISDATTWAGQKLLTGTGGNNGNGTFVMQIGGRTSSENQIAVTVNAMSAAALGVGEGNIAVAADASTLETVGGSVLQVGGTPAAGDKFEFTLGGEDFSYTVLSADIGADAAETRENVASEIADLINASTNQPGITATAAEDGSVTLAQSLVFSGGTAGTNLDAAEEDYSVTSNTFVIDTATSGVTAGVYDFKVNGVNVSAEIGGTTEFAATKEGLTAAFEKAINTLIGDGNEEDNTFNGLSATVSLSGDDITINFAASAVSLVDVAADPAASTSALSVASAADARSAIEAIDSAIQAVNTQRANLGAVSNRLDNTVSNLTNIVINLEGGKGRIEDADFAAESTNLAKSQILQQASTAMLAQANASKQNVLSLLQG